MKSCLTEYADCTVNEIAEKYIEEKPQVTDIRFHAGVPVSSEQIGLICPGKPDSQDSAGILRLLGVLLSSEIKSNDKKKLLEQEFQIEMNWTAMEKEVNQMGSLSQGVERKGMKKGILQSIRALMETMDLSVQDAMDALKINEQDRPEYIELLKNEEQNN